MWRLLLNRLVGMIPMMLGITFISFLVIQLTPGEPVNLANELNPKVNAEALQKLRAHYNLDEPLHVQYVLWLGKLIQLDFGTSFAPDNRPVVEKVLQHLPVTLYMNLIGLLLVVLLAVPIGVAAAYWQDSLFDRGMTVFVFIGFAMPSFWLGLLCMLLFGVHLNWLPISGLSSFGSEAWPFWQRLADWTAHLVLPIAVGTIGALAGLSRYMRSSMLETVRQDYITTARAKGATEKRTVYVHGLRNSLISFITIMGLSIPGLIGGSVIIESLFSIPGMGKLFYDSILMRDYPLIMCVLTFGALLTLLGNLLADMCYTLADPRLRQKDKP